MSKKRVLNIVLLILSTLFIVVKSISDNDYLLDGVDETAGRC